MERYDRLQPEGTLHTEEDVLSPRVTRLKLFDSQCPIVNQWVLSFKLKVLYHVPPTPTAPSGDRLSIMIVETFQQVNASYYAAVSLQGWIEERGKRFSCVSLITEFPRS